MQAVFSGDLCDTFHTKDIPFAVGERSDVAPDKQRKANVTEVVGNAEEA